MRDDLWVDSSEYPSADDIEKFGYDSPWDDDPLTIGYVGDDRPPFWTPAKIVLAIVVLFLIGVLILSLLR